MPGITTPLRERTSRKPTGLPNPPMILLCGPEKCGKSYEAALGTTSDLVGMTYWLEIGGSEGTADYYGRIPGVRYEIVEHDGTYQDICDAVRWILRQPRIDGKPNMIVVDNGTNLWDMLSDEQALFARRRAVRKAQENRRRVPSLDDPVVVDADLWNRAKDRWGEFLWLLRRHSGPVVMIARQEIVTAFENDKPTRNTTRKIKAEKNLPAAVDAIVELHSLGEAYLTGVRTLHWEVKPGETVRFDDFSIDTLLRRLGFHEAATTRQVTENRPEAYLDEQQAQQQSQQQRERPQQQRNAPALTGDQAVELIRKALADETDPEMCLQGLREEWGIRTLRQIRTHTQQWGAMSADDLISRSIAYAKERAEWKRQQAAQQQKEQPTGPATPPPGQAVPEEAREHQAHTEPDPPAEDDTPPPPDPQAEEPPPNESPEDTSAAEEPQVVPPAPTPPAATPPAARQNRKAALALKALHAEADVQARLRMMTVGEHLGPISEAGDPPMTVLRDYLQQHRPELIEQLEREGHAELAAYYRSAPTVEPQIQEKFAAYFEGAPAGQK
ncbi:hypothetical protein AB0D65_29295 [Streptomyces griseoloalbus]|uniref:AAA domain-containing protein n=1 Tax=Streptomyces griseoloalbus TaxID=67303 RepID=A0ABV3ECV0_9ACTN